MAIYKRGNNYWIAFCFNKHRYRKRSPDNSHKGAKAYEILIRQKLARGQPLEEPKPETRYKFKEIVLQWLNVSVKNNNKPSDYTIKRYILNADIIPYFGAKNMDEISVYSLEQYKTNLLKEKNLSPKTINNRLSIISGCLKSAMEWGVIKEVPRIKFLKVPPQKYDYLTEAETEKLLIHTTGKWHDMILITVRTGLRIGELLALRWEDINLQEKILTVNQNIVRGIEGSPKNNKTRTVPLTPSVVKMLVARIKDNKYIFHDDNGKALKYNVCLRRLHKICRLTGLRKISWHTLRHSFASHLGAKPNSIVAIKEVMGHADIKTTMRYVHVNLSVLQNIIESLEPGFQENATMLPQQVIQVLKLLPNYQNTLGKSEK